MLRFFSSSSSSSKIPSTVSKWIALTETPQGHFDTFGSFVPESLLSRTKPAPILRRTTSPSLSQPISIASSKHASSLYPMPEDKRVLADGRLRFGVTVEEVEGLPPKVQALFSVDSATIREQRSAQVRAARSAAGRHPIDTGSPEAQVAADTAKISQLSAHMAAHRHDVTVRRALDRYINKRRKLLKYLRKRNPQSYFELVKRLGLRDIGA